jgi:hypothetical protein
MKPLSTQHITENNMKKFMFLVALLLVSPFSQAEDDFVDSYTARLSSEDHFNSDGQRLKNVADIIRQDRANYHKFNVRDNEDSNEGFFADKDNRERIPTMLKKGQIDKATANSILNGTPVVTVTIFTKYIKVSLE